MIIHILDIKLIYSKPGKCEELLISVNEKLNITSWHPAKELGKNTTTDQMGGTEETQGKGVPQTGEPTAPPMASNYETNRNQPLGRPWSTGLFDCHENQTNAVMTAFLPCVTFGQIAEVLDGGEMACHLGSFIYLLMMPALCSQWIMGSKYRTKLREKYGLVEAPYTDVISHVFCPCCSLCQEFRELKSRGLDPALGWNGILAQQQVNQYQGETLGVPAAQTMYK